MRCCLSAVLAQFQPPPPPLTPSPHPGCTYGPLLCPLCCTPSHQGMTRSTCYSSMPLLHLVVKIVAKVLLVSILHASSAPYPSPLASLWHRVLTIAQRSLLLSHMTLLTSQRCKYCTKDLHLVSRAAFYLSSRSVCCFSQVLFCIQGLDLPECRLSLTHGHWQANLPFLPPPPCPPLPLPMTASSHHRDARLHIQLVHAKLPSGRHFCYCCTLQCTPTKSNLNSVTMLWSSKKHQNLIPCWDPALSITIKNPLLCRYCKLQA